MKIITALLISAAILLTSCVSTSVPDKTQPDESSPYPAHGSSVTSYGFDLNNLNYNPQPGIIDSTMRKAGEISAYVEEPAPPAPEFCINKQYTYMLRSCPAGMTSYEDYRTFRRSGELIREIEVYENHDYSAPVRIIPLTGLEDKFFAVWAISYNPDDGNFYILLNETDDGTPDGDYGLVFYKFSPDGEYIDSRSVEKQGSEPFQINKGKLYFVKNGGRTGSSGKLIGMDPFAGTQEVIHDAVLTVSFSDYVMYYVRAWRIDGESFDAAIFTIDPTTGKEIQFAKINPNINSFDGNIGVFGACWDDRNDILTFHTVPIFSQFRTAKRKLRFQRTMLRLLLSGLRTDVSPCDAAIHFGQFIIRKIKWSRLLRINSHSIFAVISGHFQVWLSPKMLLSFSEILSKL